MGRGKLNMEMIKREKPRMITYQKRKKGLLKKAEELSILCDIKTCVIIHGPKYGDQNLRELVTFPQDREEVTKIINKFMSKPLSSSSAASRGRNSNNLLDFFTTRQKKVNDEIIKLRRDNMEAKFPSWDDSLNGFSFEHLEATGKKVAFKLEDAKKKLVMKMKGKSKGSIMENYWPKLETGWRFQSFNYNANNVENTTHVSERNFMQFNDYGYNNRMQPENQNQNFPACYYPTNNQAAWQKFLCSGINCVPSINNNELQGQGHDFFGGDRHWMDRANNGMQTPQHKFPKTCYDVTMSTKPEMLENIVYNSIHMNSDGIPNSQQMMNNHYGEQQMTGMDNSYSSLLNTPDLLNVPEFHDYFKDTMPRS
ncbi:hypothetical protein ACFE04_016022 [Oxalis oulophora]